MNIDGDSVKAAIEGEDKKIIICSFDYLKERLNLIQNVCLVLYNLNPICICFIRNGVEL